MITTYKPEDDFNFDDEAKKLLKAIVVVLVIATIALYFLI